MKLNYPKALLLFGLLCWLSLRWHRDTGLFNYRAELWADKSGYFVYMPATFIYGFHARAFPDSIEAKVGYGFALDRPNDKVVVKYTSGVAILQAPFFLGAHLLTLISGGEADGFSTLYQKSVDVASAFYLCLGLILLYGLLTAYFRSEKAALTLGVMLFGTNLYWYGISETAMSHVYSFFLFAAYLWLVQQLFVYGKGSLKYVMLLGAVAGMIVLIRPTNVVFVLFAFFWDVRSWKDIRGRLLYILHPLRLLPLAAMALLVMLPQLMYWKYLSGKFLYYSYGEEGFDYWRSPVLKELWLSTNNGWLVFNPIHVFTLAGIVFMLIRHRTNSVIIFLVFLISTYLFASWHTWHFGCGYGSRSYVEYYTLLCIPIGHLLVAVSKSDSAWFRRSFCVLMFLVVFYNIQLTYHSDNCWFGGNWDYAAVWKLFLEKPS